MRDFIRDACEELDASIFSGDLLYVEEELAELKEYLGRWNRAVAQHEEISVIDDAASDAALNNPEDCWVSHKALEMQLSTTTQQLEALKAVLRGADYRDVDGLASLPVDRCTAIGEEVASRTNDLIQQNSELKAMVNELRTTLTWVMSYANDYNSKVSGHKAAYEASVEVLNKGQAQSLHGHNQQLLIEFKKEAAKALNPMLRDMISRGQAVDMVNLITLKDS